MSIADPDLLARLTAYIPLMIAASFVTVGVTLAAWATATVIGLVVAIGRFLGQPILSALVHVYLAVFRNTPELVQLYVGYFGLPAIGVVLSPLVVAVLVLGLHYGAYLSEVFRGGILSIDRGQWDAAKVLGLHRRFIWQKVILPQVFGKLLPPWFSYLLVMFKVSAITAAITVNELTFTAGTIASRNFRFFELFSIITVLYLAISFPAIVIARRLELGRRTA